MDLNRLKKEAVLQGKPLQFKYEETPNSEHPGLVSKMSFRRSSDGKERTDWQVLMEGVIVTDFAYIFRPDPVTYYQLNVLDKTFSVWPDVYGKPGFFSDDLKGTVSDINYEEPDAHLFLITADYQEIPWKVRQMDSIPDDTDPQKGP